MHLKIQQKMNMKILQGKPVSGGIATGKAFLLESESIRIPVNYISDGQPQKEIKRLLAAMDEVVAELHSFADTIREDTSSTIAGIFVGHAGMLEDEAFREELKEAIQKKHYTAEFAIARVMRRWREIFRKKDFLRARVADLDDLERRLLRHLLDREREDLSSLEGDVVLVAHTLTPTQTASLDSGKIKGIATDGDGPTSHTAIIASAYGIPAVVGLGDITSRVAGGETIIIDGNKGDVIADPDKKTSIRYWRRREERMESDRKLLEQMRGLPSKTLDGRHIFSLVANIESPDGIAKALEHGAEGVGLYRTELLFLGRDHMPTVEEHFHSYMRAIRQLDGRPVVMRTLDIRADKLIAGRPGREDHMPFKGLRSLRYCLENPAIFKTQLRAILKASASGNVSVMFPLVSGPEELEEAREVLDEVKAGMDESGDAYDPDMPVGVMIELPGAVMSADALAAECDFFSIGTNDLIQYTLAVDRTSARAAGLYRPEHPAVLQLIKLTIEAADRADIPVGLCGAMASACFYTPLLIGLGLDSLSVAPPQSLPKIKKVIRSLKFSDAREVAGSVMNARGPERARELLREANEFFLAGSLSENINCSSEE